MKKCKNCQKLKILNQFPPDKRKKQGVGATCKECRLNKYYRSDTSNVKAKSSLYYSLNKSKCLEKQRIYRLLNKEKRKIYLSKRRKEPEFRIIASLRNRVRLALKNNQKTGSAIKDLGCSIPQLKIHLEEQFKPGMSWNNYGLGKNKWTIDHIVPLSKVNLLIREEYLKVNNYTNLQPLWFIDNIRKGNREL